MINAEDLLAEYKANEVRADAKFKGKRVRVLGVVDVYGEGRLDSIYVTLRAPDCFPSHGVPDREKCPPEAVQAFFEDEQAGQAAQLNKLDVIALDCTGEGLMMNVLFKRCTMAKIPNNPMPRAHSAQPIAPAKKGRR